MSVRFKSIHLQFISNIKFKYDMTRLVSVPCLSISFLVWTIRIHILIFYLYSISTQISSCLVLVRSNHLLLGRFEAIPSIIRYISNLAYLIICCRIDSSPLHILSDTSLIQLISSSVIVSVQIQSIYYQIHL